MCFPQRYNKAGTLLTQQRQAKPCSWWSVAISTAGPSRLHVPADAWAEAAQSKAAVQYHATQFSLLLPHLLMPFSVTGGSA